MSSQKQEKINGGDSIADVKQNHKIQTNKNEIVKSETVNQVLTAIDEIIYEWDIQSDSLYWSDNATNVFNIVDPNKIATGKKFADLLSRDNATNLYETIINSREMDEGNGVYYQIEYCLVPDKTKRGRVLWIEDTGRWYSDKTGKPSKAIGSIRIINARHEKEQKLNYLSNYDPLTGLMNRARLIEGLEEIIETVERYSTSCCYLLAAVDNLAMVNDAYGFDVADEVIAAVCQRLRESLRSGDSIGRYAGNKFGIILSNCNIQDMRIAAERLLRAVHETVLQTEAGPVSVTISMGGLAIPLHASSATEAMVRAEETLNQVKSKRRNSFVCYQKREKRESERKRNIMFADEIISALNDRRLNIAYQPIVNASDEEPLIYECLCRMVRPDGEVVSADHFIQAAEHLGLVRLIDHRMLELTLASLEKYPDIQLSLNISGMTVSDPEWLGTLTSYIGSHREAAKRLIIEITETVAIHDVEEISVFISKLRSLGCQIAIDDFGAGYTSFRNLKLFDIDIVKLDGSFCVNLHDNQDNQFFVRTLIDLTKNFDLKTIAEWVENEKDAALLKEWGIDYMQGFLYGAASAEIPQRNSSGQKQASNQKQLNVTLSK